MAVRAERARRGLSRGRVLSAASSAAVILTANVAVADPSPEASVAVSAASSAQAPVSTATESTQPDSAGASASSAAAVESAASASGGPVAASAAALAAAPPSAQVGGPPLQLNYTDARPDKEHKTRQYLTLWRLSCAFGVQDLGDEFVDRIGQLRHDLTAAYGERLVGKTIVVDHYHLYLNQRAMQGQHNLATAAFGVLAIGVGGGAKTTAPACSQDKMPEGWFDPAELTTPWSPFIAEMDVRIDGQAHHVHSVYSPPKNMPAPGVLTDFDVKAEAAAVHAAVDKANAALVAEVAGQLGPPASASTH
jgi:hypothetical protein